MARNKQRTSSKEIMILFEDPINIEKDLLNKAFLIIFRKCKYCGALFYDFIRFYPTSFELLSMLKSRPTCRECRK